MGVRSRGLRVSIDPHDLLLRRVDAAGEDARLDRRAIAARPDQRARLDTARQRADDATARVVTADQRHELRAAAEARHVARGVAGAAGDDFGGVVLENQDRRLARHTRHPAVDILVGDEIAQHHDAATATGGDEIEQTIGCHRRVGGHAVDQDIKRGIVVWAWGLGLGPGT